MRFLSPRQREVGFGEEAGGGPWAERRGAVPRGPGIPRALSSQGSQALALPAGPGDGVPARRAWGSREKLNGDAHLACFGLFGAPVAGKNCFFSGPFLAKGFTLRLFDRGERLAGLFVQLHLIKVVRDGKRSREAKLWHL